MHGIWTTHLSTILNSFRMSPAPLFKRRVNDSLIWFVLLSKESKLTYKCLGGHSFQRSERFSDGFMFCGGCSTVFDSSKRDRFPSRGDRMARVHYLNSMACNGWECVVWIPSYPYSLNLQAHVDAIVKVIKKVNAANAKKVLFILVTIWACTSKVCML